MLRTTCRLGTLMLLLVLDASCGGAVPDPINDDSGALDHVTHLDFLPSTLHLNISDTAVVGPRYLDLADEPFPDVHSELTWTSSDPSIVTVVAKGANYDGHLTAVSPGSATITAVWHDSVRASLFVTVGQPWAFDSVTGSPVGSWQDSKGSASATLRFVPRDTVYEGLSYNLIYKFISSVMINDAFSGRPSASISIGFSNLGLPAYIYDVPRNSGAMVPGTPLKDSIGLSITWPTIPVGASLVGVEVRGSIPTGAPPNSAIVLRAYYHKVTH